MFNCSTRLIRGLWLTSTVVHEYNEYWFFRDPAIPDTWPRYTGHVSHGLRLCDRKVSLLTRKTNGVELFVYVNTNSSSDGLISALSHKNHTLKKSLLSLWQITLFYILAIWCLTTESRIFNFAIPLLVISEICRTDWLNGWLIHGMIQR